MDEFAQATGGSAKAAVTPYPRFMAAALPSQKNSIAQMRENYKHALYEDVTLKNLDVYHNISCRPITKVAEDDMELLSDLVTWGEQYLHHYEEGVYVCSRCSAELFSSQDKWHGPCVWPSFRKGIFNASLSLSEVLHYNNYKCVVKEVYCGTCDLFLGHAFEDGKAKGDSHPDAHWRF